MLRIGRDWRNKYERKNAKIELQMGWRDKWLSRLVHTVAQKTNLPKVVTGARGCKLSPHESRKGISPLARPIHPIRCNRNAPDGTEHRLNVTELRSIHARTRALDCSYTCLSLWNTIWKRECVTYGARLPKESWRTASSCWHEGESHRWYGWNYTKYLERNS